MILGDVEEIVTTIELDEETFEEIFKVCKCITALKMLQRVGRGSLRKSLQ